MSRPYPGVPHPYRATLDRVQAPTHGNVVQAINNLTGSYFGYHPGSDAWRPTTPENRAAIAEFAEWVKKNAGN